MWNGKWCGGVHDWSEPVLKTVGTHLQKGSTEAERGGCNPCLSLPPPPLPSHPSPPFLPLLTLTHLTSFKRSHMFPTQKQQRDDDFLRRLQKHRFSEFNKYDDDYYGEKVVTPSDYRQWVRQQQKKRKDATQLGAASTAASSIQPASTTI